MFKFTIVTKIIKNFIVNETYPKSCMSYQENYNKFMSKIYNSAYITHQQKFQNRRNKLRHYNSSAIRNKLNNK